MTVNIRGQLDLALQRASGICEKPIDVRRTVQRTIQALGYVVLLRQQHGKHNHFWEEVMRGTPSLMLKVQRHPSQNQTEGSPLTHRGTSRGSWRVAGTPLLLLANFSHSTWFVTLIFSPEIADNDVKWWERQRLLYDRYTTRMQALDAVEMAVLSDPPPWHTPGILH